INTIHTGGTEASKADFDVAKGLETYLLLARGACVMLRMNLFFVEFNTYSSPAITSTEDKRIVPILPI
ncbi:21239_t:CDS:2, partial [Racocetra persica]